MSEWVSERKEFEGEFLDEISRSWAALLKKGGHAKVFLVLSG